jgi:RNA-directed DNA polymerase
MADLRDQFYKLETRANVACLLGVDESYLIYDLYIKPSPKRYTTFSIPKKSGGIRSINAPNDGLKFVQQRLNQVLQTVYTPKKTVHSFISEKSIITNAKQHQNRRWILNVDLKDFFPSINFGRVYGMFMAWPYERNHEVATILAQICCYKNELPQGAPTSPIISNMLCARLDSDLLHLSKQNDCIYTRYADDLTFSTRQRKFPTALAISTKLPTGYKTEAGNELKQIIEDNNGFKINTDKVRLQRNGTQRQEVTGIVVNKFPNVKRDFVRQVRAMLHDWDKRGYKDAQERFWGKYDKKPRPHKGKPPFWNVVKGKINFLGQVRGKDNLIYRRYHDQFLDLMYGTIESAIWLLEYTRPDGKVTQGTGFVLKGFGMITCHHVLRPNTKASLPPAPKEFPIKCVMKDKHIDLAILEAPTPNKRYLIPRFDGKVQLGDQITLLGYPNFSPGATITKNSGKVTSFRNLHGIKHVIIDTPILTGNSGGPVLDADNRVIGVAVRGIDSGGAAHDTDVYGVIPIEMLNHSKVSKP